MHTFLSLTVNPIVYSEKSILIQIFLFGLLMMLGIHFKIKNNALDRTFKLLILVVGFVTYYFVVNLYLERANQVTAYLALSTYVSISGRYFKKYFMESFVFLGIILFIGLIIHYYCLFEVWK